MFLVATVVSIWKVGWSRLTFIFLILMVLSSLPIVAHYWSIYQQRVRIEAKARQDKEADAKRIAATDFQLYQPAQNVQDLTLKSFQVVGDGKAGRLTLKAYYESAQSHKLSIEYGSALKQSNQIVWGCSSEGVSLHSKSAAGPCTKVGVMTDGTVVYRQTYGSQNDNASIYSAVIGDVIFVGLAERVPAETVITALNGFQPVDRAVLQLSK
jgi:hypothetical protein